MRFKRCISLLMCFFISLCIISCGKNEDDTNTGSDKSLNDQTSGELGDKDNATEADCTDNAAEADCTDNAAAADDMADAAEANDKDSTFDADDHDNSDVKDTDSASAEDASPWTLVSESTVTTRVSYAAFLNDKVGLTVGYAGATSFTEDGGTTWSVSDNVSACRYGLDYYDESYIVSGGNTGVNLLSTDKGNTWTPLADFPLKMHDVYNKFVSVVDKDNIYLASMISFAVSNDGGASWNELKLPEGCKKIAAMSFLTSEMGFILGPDGTLYKTTDACNTWTSSKIDLEGEDIPESKMPWAAIRFQDENNGMIVYIGKTRKLYGILTEDGGSTWKPVTMPDILVMAPFISRDGKYLTLSSSLKTILLYKLEVK